MIVELEAQEELLAAAIWYDEQREGLGSEFLKAIDEALVGVAESPSSFPRDAYDDRARRALVPRFPYAVVFVMHHADVRVVAVMHAKRLPGYWANRV
jgi:plasmid stabilization system protein ParE